MKNENRIKDTYSVPSTFKMVGIYFADEKYVNELYEF